MMVTEGGQKYELNNIKICALQAALGPSLLILFSPMVDAEHAVCVVHIFMLHTCEACWDSKKSFVKVKLEFKFLGSDRMIIALHFSNFLVNVEGSAAACDIAHECISRQ